MSINHHHCGSFLLIGDLGEKPHQPGPSRPSWQLTDFFSLICSGCHSWWYPTSISNPDGSSRSNCEFLQTFKTGNNGALLEPSKGRIHILLPWASESSSSDDCSAFIVSLHASFHALYVSDLVSFSSVSLFRVHQEWRWDSKLDYTQKCYFIAHLPVLQGDKGEIGLKGEKVVCSLKNSMNMGMASSLLHSLECPCRVTLELLESLLRWR